MFKEDFSFVKDHVKRIKRQATGQRCGSVVECFPSTPKRPWVQSLVLKGKKGSNRRREAFTSHTADKGLVLR